MWKYEDYMKQKEKQSDNYGQNTEKDGWLETASYNNK